MFGKSKHQQSPLRRQPNSSPEPPTDIKSFRPGRTLTGSRSSRISSSGELNAEMVSPRAKTHHLVKHRRRLVGRLIFIVIACIGIYMLIGQLVATVHVRGMVDDSEYINLTDIQKTAYAATVDEYFSHRVNERFRPNLNSADLTTYMQSAHPEVESLNVQPSAGLGEAELELHMRRPVARWVVDGKTEFVNQDGIVFGENFYSSPHVTIVDKNAAELSNGLVASNRFLSFVGQVVGGLEEEDLRVTKATIPFLTTRQLEIRIKGVKSYFKLTLDRSAGEQSEDIARITSYLKKRQMSPSYVDVRVKGKAFYR